MYNEGMKVAIQEKEKEGNIMIGIKKKMKNKLKKKKYCSKRKKKE